MAKRLIIITGPPGAGKTTLADLLGLPVYDADRGNKAYWRDSKQDCVLVTAAAPRHSKEYWLAQARTFGFTPELYVLDPGRTQATQRLLKRDNVYGRDQRLTKSVQRWYLGYSRHPDEIKQQDFDAQSILKAEERRGARTG